MASITGVVRRADTPKLEIRTTRIPQKRVIVTTTFGPPRRVGGTGGGGRGSSSVAPSVNLEAERARKLEEQRLATEAKLTKDLELKREKELRDVNQKIQQELSQRQLSLQQRVEIKRGAQSRRLETPSFEIQPTKVILKKRFKQQKTKIGAPLVSGGVRRPIRKPIFTPEARVTKKWVKLGNFERFRRAERVGKEFVLRTSARSLRVRKNGNIINLIPKPDSKLFKASKTEPGVLIEKGVKSKNGGQAKFF